MRANDVLKRYKDEDLPEFVELDLVDVNQVGNFGNRPLHVAAVRGDLSELDALIEGGAQINCIGEHGNSPLHEAALQGHKEIVKHLLHHGANPMLKNENGETAYDLAAGLEQHDVAHVLDQWSQGTYRPN